MRRTRPVKIRRKRGEKFGEVKKKSAKKKSTINGNQLRWNTRLRALCLKTRKKRINDETNATSEKKKKIQSLGGSDQLSVKEKQKLLSRK